MKTMVLVMPLSGHGRLGMNAAHFTCLLTGMATETRTGSWLREQELTSCVWQTVEKGQLQSPRKMRCGHRATVQLSSSECAIHTAPGPHTLPLLLFMFLSVFLKVKLGLKAAQGLSLKHRLCLSLALRCKSLRLEFADSNPGSSGKHRSHLNL